jgi:hypothetical protein
MSLQAQTGRVSSGLGGLMRLLIAIAAPLAGFLAVSNVEHCGPRLLLMSLGMGIASIAARSVAARIMRLDAFGTLVFAILTTAFVFVAGPLMDQCRPGF